MLETAKTDRRSSLEEKIKVEIEERDLEKD